MKKPTPPRIAIIDNSIDPEIYRPVEHWASFLPPGWQAFRAPDGKLPGRGEDFSHIIVTGSEASILELEPWVEREIDFVREADRRGRAILGSCYGHQLLARALAGPETVGPCRRPEIGWIPLESQTDSRIFGPRGSVSYSFSVHFDEVRNLPPGFVVLAGTALCPVQAFVLAGRPVWGYQIHPEIDPRRGRALLQAQAERCGRGGSGLYLEALGQAPRDSGLIRSITAEFLAAFFPSEKGENLA